MAASSGTRPSHAIDGQQAEMKIGDGIDHADRGRKQRPGRSEPRRFPQGLVDARLPAGTIGLEAVDDILAQAE
jgi:hypothetical protein